MYNLEYSACLCPVRATEEGIETLLTKRVYFNKEMDRPMKFPGEWVFAGGMFSRSDTSLRDTAIREFYEETDYDGDIANTVFLRIGKGPLNGKQHYIAFYGARIDDSFSFGGKVNGEVLDTRWMNVDDALSLICSDEFTYEQNKLIAEMGINSLAYGDYRIDSRQFPSQVVETLKLIHSISTRESRTMCELKKGLGI
ncbi:MAG: NUDIX hydrolase [Nanoarchaeota archaeon]